VGCSGEKSTPEDDAFQNELAQAAAKNKGRTSGKRGGGIKPPQEAMAGAKGGGAAADKGTSPAAGTAGKDAQSTSK